MAEFKNLEECPTSLLISMMVTMLAGPSSHGQMTNFHEVIGGVIAFFLRRDGVTYQRLLAGVAVEIDRRMPSSTVVFS